MSFPIGSKTSSGKISARLSKCDSVPGTFIDPGSKSNVTPPSSSGVTSIGPFSGSCS